MQTNHLGNKTLIGSLLLAAILLLLCSCGARKVDRSKTTSVETAQVETTKVDSSKTVTVSDTNVKITDFGTEEEFTITPIDPTKEMIVNSVKYANAVLKHRKSKRNKVIESGKKSSQTAQNSIKEVFKAQTHKATVIEMKKSDKEQFSFLSLWWLLLLLLSAGFMVYRFWKKQSPF